MKIETLTSSDFDEELLASYAEAFNEVFRKKFTADSLRDKYVSTCRKISYHSLFIDDEENAVAGGCTAMPIRCAAGNKTVNAALLVDVFIREKYRGNPLSLYKMYKKLVERLLEDGVSFVLAVPNSVAYPYWKNIVKFKDIGSLDYWIMPIKIGNVLKRFRFLNLFSDIFCRMALGLSVFIAKLRDGKNSPRKYFQIKDAEFLKDRFPENKYTRISEPGIEFYYKIVDEDGVKAAYIFYATKGGVFSHKALNEAVSHILKSENSDIIFYIGQIDFFQTSLIRVPQKMEPKLLPLTCDMILCDKGLEDITDISLWDFGLANYDVR